MSEPIRLTTPLTQDKVRSLHIGDRVLISGTIYAARDAAHKRMVETLDRGEPLPVDLRDQIVYYVGPSPAKPGQAIGSAGPTTSGRMDAYAPRLMEKGLSGMIGKGNRSQAVKDAMQRYRDGLFRGHRRRWGAAVPLHPFVYGAGLCRARPGSAGGDGGRGLPRHRRGRCRGR